jgi:antitoxin component of RelBE/YafQ-DinJ toxin-antitoxin module
MATIKDDRIYVRISSDVKLDFELVAAYQGLTPSAMLHSFIVKTIHEAKQASPQIFKREAEEEENKSAESENSEKVMTLDEAKADDKKKGNKK